MDRHAKKLEKKRKQRELAKKQSRQLAERRPSPQEALVRQAAREPMGACWISADWDDMTQPALVSAVVTRRLPDGRLLPGIALVDRTCLGVKNGFAAQPMLQSELDDQLARMGQLHGGMVRCEPLVIQSVVFHAIDHARALGFEPDPDFPAAMFGPRPEQLLATPWHAIERPLYIAGPSDDPRAVKQQLARAVGAGNFDEVTPFADLDEDFAPEHEDGRPSALHARSEPVRRVLTENAAELAQQED